MNRRRNRGPRAAGAVPRLTRLLLRRLSQIRVETRPDSRSGPDLCGSATSGSDQRAGQRSVRLASTQQKACCERDGK